MYEPGAQPKVIQEMGGWSSIDIVMNRYGHLFDTLQDDLADKQEASYRALAEGRTGT